MGPQITFRISLIFQLNLHEGLFSSELTNKIWETIRHIRLVNFEKG